MRTSPRQRRGVRGRNASHTSSSGQQLLRFRLGVSILLFVLSSGYLYATAPPGEGAGGGKGGTKVQPGFGGNLRRTGYINNNNDNNNDNNDNNNNNNIINNNNNIINNNNNIINNNNNIINNNNNNDNNNNNNNNDSPLTLKTVDSDRDHQYSIPNIIKYINSYIRSLHEVLISNKHSSTASVWDQFHSLTYSTLYQWDKDYRSHMPPRRSDGSIFLSLASYRDENCFPTMRDAFGMASHPDKLFVGLVQQNCHDGCRSGVLEGGRMEDVGPDDDCYDLFCASEEGRPYCLNEQVRLIDINETESLGPYAARFFASKLWSGEEWYMQIDSHMTFASGWDSKSTEMLQRAPSSKPVLTHYPPSHTSPLGGPGGRICDPLFATSDIESQIVRLQGANGYERKKGTYPRFAPFVAAGYYVAHSEFLKDVPFDPFLPWVFMGEEISMSARLWTAGYDIFSPTESVMGHIYVRRHKPKFWESVGRVFHPGFHNSIQMFVINRIKHSMGYPECARDMVSPESLLTAMDDYGLGKVRTLKDYMEMAGLDTKTKIVTKAQWCHDGVPPPGFEEFNNMYKT